MNDEELPSQRRIDWKAVIAALALTWTLLLGGLGVFRANLLAVVDTKIAEHSESAASKRAAFLRDIDAKSIQAINRMGEIEHTVVTLRDWRNAVDAQLTSLHEFRDTCGPRIERIFAQIESIQREIDKLDQVMRERKAFASP